MGLWTPCLAPRAVPLSASGGALTRPDSSGEGQGCGWEPWGNCGAAGVGVRPWGTLAPAPGQVGLAGLSMWLWRPGLEWASGALAWPFQPEVERD